LRFLSMPLGVFLCLLLSHAAALAEVNIDAAPVLITEAD
jgi:hypothetical protein